MLLVNGSRFAEEVKAELAPFCERIEIAGSILREKCEPGDIEIVCIPKVERVGLFGEEETRSAGFINAVNSWVAIKGKATGKYTQRIYKEEKLDIFMACEENWGLILAIRTGSTEYVRFKLAGRWAKMGYHSHEGMLQDPDGQPVPIREEKELFELLGMEWVEPTKREL